ncbi:alpha-2-antiplasmin [Python bivittatus]|uniref:Alpha-2-antiplasmin n=1 Tax=Python bivittatus TaxID=176946 RepID=A0A9F2RC78_PYTBI|nr:alpha-2-antiplasmin [Python bivittatus]
MKLLRGTFCWPTPRRYSRKRLYHRLTFCLRQDLNPSPGWLFWAPQSCLPLFQMKLAARGTWFQMGPKGWEDTQTLSRQEEEEEEQGCEDSALSPSVHKIAWAMRALGVDLLRELEAEQSKDNTLFSPLSLSLSLAHLALGAANQTQKRLLEVLHMDSVPCLHQALRRVSRRLHETALSIAGRLYLEKGFPIKEKFLKESQRFYGVKPAVLSGNSEADLAAINSWVEEATNGQISTMLTELPPSVVMVLLNAVYFQGFWKTKFDPLLTEPSMFHLDDEFAVSVEMMKEQEYPLSWFSMEPLNGQVAKFPFKGNTTFVAIIPSHHERNFSQFLSEVLQVNLETSFPEERSTMVKMPKLHLQDHTDLNQALIRLGLGELFSSPDLRPIAEGPLLVSSVQHQATLDLAEAGVQASAATSVVAYRSFSAFCLDQPFIFMILEKTTGVPLFFGSIRNPNPGAPRQKKTKGFPLSEEKEGLPFTYQPDPWKP